MENTLLENTLLEYTLAAGLTWVGAKDTTVFKKKEKYHLPYSSFIDDGHDEEADGGCCVVSFSAQT